MLQLITPAPVLSEPPDYIPTGNLSVSLPSISRRDAGVYCLGVLQMGANALLEISGSEAERQPFLQPFLMQDGRRLALGALQWRREGYWLPQFLAKTDRIEVQGTIYAPPGEKGFVYLLELKPGAASACSTPVLRAGGRASRRLFFRGERWKPGGGSGMILGVEA